MPRMIFPKPGSKKKKPNSNAKKVPTAGGFYDPKAGKLDVTEGYVYSTCKIGQAAFGRISLFTVPHGHLMPSIGDEHSEEAAIKLTDAHTNILEAGQLGSLGEAVFKTIRVIARDMAASVEARLAVRVAGAPQFTSPLAPLLNKVDPTLLAIPILCARMDTLEVEIVFDHPVTAFELPTGFAFLRVELAGAFARDV